MALVHFQTEGELPEPKLLCDDRLTTVGIRASGHQHPVSTGTPMAASVC